MSDPRNGDVRYVGATKNPQQRRLAYDYQATNSDMEAWFDELRSEGLGPEMTVVEVVSFEELHDGELDAIDRLSKEWDLLNSDQGIGYAPKTGEKSELYQLNGYSTDDELASDFEDFAKDFSSESKAVIYCIRHALQREAVNDE